MESVMTRRFLLCWCVLTLTWIGCDDTDDSGPSNFEGDDDDTGDDDDITGDDDDVTGDDDTSGDDDVTADASSRIYTGYWPYYPDKAAITSGVPLDGVSVCSVHDTLGRFTGVDQYGDLVELYDFAYQGKFILLNVSAMWGSWDMELAAYMAGQPSYFDAYDAQFAPVRDGVDNGDIHYISILSEDPGAGAVSPADVAARSSTYPNTAIPILADSAELMPTHIDLYGYPSLSLLDESMVLVSNSDTGDYFSVVADAIFYAGL